MDAEDYYKNFKNHLEFQFKDMISNADDLFKTLQEEIKVETLKNVLDILYNLCRKTSPEKSDEDRGIAIGLYKAREVISDVFEKIAGITYEGYLMWEHEIYADEDEEANVRARQRDRERRAEYDRQQYEDYNE